MGLFAAWMKDDIAVTKKKRNDIVCIDEHFLMWELDSHLTNSVGRMSICQNYAKMDKESESEALFSRSRSMINGYGYDAHG